eukprot:Clim_evm25s201 gene=Clim_evmTU25s201
MNTFLHLVIAAVLAALTHGFIIDVDAHDVECFFVQCQPRDKITLTYEVMEGGFLDIDVSAFDPSDTQLHKSQRQSSGRVSLSARKDGRYKFCLGNEMSTRTVKTVKFDLTRSRIEPPEPLKDEQQNRLLQMVTELNEKLITIKHEQEYLEVREKIHREISDSTNSRVVMWSFFEALVIVAMTAGQIWYLRRFFENKRLM